MSGSSSRFYDEDGVELTNEQVEARRAKMKLPITRDEFPEIDDPNNSAMAAIGRKMINMAIADATASIKADPDSLCDASRFLMNMPVEDGGWEWDAGLDTWLTAALLAPMHSFDQDDEWMRNAAQSFGHDYVKQFSDAATDYLDRLADDVRKTKLPFETKTPDIKPFSLELWMRLPVHKAPDRDRSRKRVRAVPDPRQTSITDLLAA